MLPLTPEFLDAMCRAGPLDRGWFLINVEKFGTFVWQEGDKEAVFKIENVESWLEEKQLVESNVDELASCKVRNILAKKAKIKSPESQSIEAWINIMVPQSLGDHTRVEIYTDQKQALLDAEDEAEVSLEVHTKRVMLKVP